MMRGDLTRTRVWHIKHVLLRPPLGEDVTPVPEFFSKHAILRGDSKYQYFDMHSGASDKFFVLKLHLHVWRKVLVSYEMVNRLFFKIKWFVFSAGNVSCWSYKFTILTLPSPNPPRQRDVASGHQDPSLHGHIDDTRWKIRKGLLVKHKARLQSN